MWRYQLATFFWNHTQFFFNPGMQIIYPGEPAQAVFFRMNQLQLIDIVDTHNTKQRATSINRLFTRDKRPGLSSRAFSRETIEYVDGAVSRRKVAQINDVVINRGDFFKLVNPIKYVFNNCVMTNCDFSESERLDWGFNGCDLSNSSFSKLGGMGINKLLFSDCSMDDVSFSESQVMLKMSNCAFNFIDLSGATVHGEIDVVRGMLLRNTTFDSCKFSADFAGVDTSGAVFYNCDFSEARNVRPEQLRQG